MESSRVASEEGLEMGRFMRARGDAKVFERELSASAFLFFFLVVFLRWPDGGH